MAFMSYARSTFLQIYGDSSSLAAANHQNSTSTCTPRTIANTPLLSDLAQKETTAPSSSSPQQQYTTEPTSTPPTPDEMAAFKAIPPHKKNPRSNRWPCSKDFPKPDPNRWKGHVDNTWESEWEAQDSPSAQWNSDKQDDWGSDAQPGWDNTGAKLTDWNGGWAPAPLASEWDSRPAFRPDQSEGQVQRWLDNSETAMAGESHIERCISVRDNVTVDGTTYAFTISEVSQFPGSTKQMGDIIPRYWIPTTFGRQPTQMFWEDIVRSKEPEPHDENDLEGVRPWWEVVPQGCSFLEDLANSHPHILDIDPDENLEERLARENDQGGINHAENRRNYTSALRRANQAKRERQQERTRKLIAKPCNSDRARSSQKLHPTAHRLFIRSARPEDISAIKAILNHYALGSCQVPQSEEFKSSDILQRYNEVVFSKLPFLVACEKGQVIKGRRRKGRAPEDDIILSDTVLGFAYAEDFSDSKGMYRYTAQIEVYTNNRHYRKGVASCLMDKTLALLDPDYLEHGGYEVRGDELEGKEPERLIKNIIMHCPVENNERLQWLTKWLEKMKFEKAGQLNGVGTKLSRAVTLAIFQRATGAVLDHANPAPISAKK